MHVHRSCENNGTPVTRYEYQLESLDNANNWTAGNWTSTGGTNTTLTLTGLTNGTDYRVGLRAVSNAGDGEESEPRSRLRRAKPIRAPLA